MVGVLEPARLGDDRQVAAELAGDRREPLADLGHRQRRPGRVDLVVDRVAAGVPVGVGSRLGRARLVDGKFSRDGKRVLLPGDEVAHQLAAGPAVGARDGNRELLVGQAGQRLVRRPGVALFLEEFERVEVHQTATGSRYSPKTSRRTAHCSPSVA